MGTPEEFLARRHAETLADAGPTADDLHTMAASSAIGMSLRGGRFADIAERANVLTPESIAALSKYQPPQWFQDLEAQGVGPQFTFQEPTPDVPRETFGPQPFPPLPPTLTAMGPKVYPNTGLPGPSPLQLAAEALTSKPIQRLGAGFSMLGFSPIVEFNDIWGMGGTRGSYRPTRRTEAALPSGNALTYEAGGVPTILEKLKEQWRREVAVWNVAAHGAPWDEESALDWINLYHRRIGGSGGPVIDTVLNVGGLAADIVIDPLWLVGPLGRLSSEGQLIRRLNVAMDDLGLVGGQRTAEFLRGLEAKGTRTGIPEPLLQGAETLEKRWAGPELTLAERARTIAETRAAGGATDEALTALERLRVQRQGLRMPGLVEQVQRGWRGGIQIPRLSRISFPSMWNVANSTIGAQTYGRLGYKGFEMVPLTDPVTKTLLTKAAGWLESKGVSDGWGILDMLFPSEETLTTAWKLSTPERTAATPASIVGPMTRTQKVEATRIGSRLAYARRPEARRIIGPVVQTIGRYTDEAARRVAMAEISAKNMGIADLQQLFGAADEAARVDERLLGLNPTRAQHLALVEDYRVQLIETVNNQQELREIHLVPGAPEGYGPGKTILNPAEAETLRQMGGTVGRLTQSQRRGLISELVAEGKTPQEAYDLVQTQVREARAVPGAPTAAIPDRFAAGTPTEPPIPVAQSVPLRTEERPPHIPEQFNTPQIRDWVREISGRQEKFLVVSRSGGLRTKQLARTARSQFEELGLAIQELKRRQVADPTQEGAVLQEAADYLRHHISSETYKILKSKQVGVIQIGKDGKAAMDPKFINAFSTAFETRQNRLGTTQFNALVWDEGLGQIAPHTVRDFFETNPAYRDAARLVEAERHRASGLFYNHMANVLSKEETYRVPTTGVPDGWKALTDFLPEREAAAMDDALRARVGSIMLPDSPGIRRMMKIQTDILSSPDHLEGVLGFLQDATNWWKVNTLGIFPAYHLGNLISNFYLLYLNGMWDPAMIKLAWDVARNPQSERTVTGKWGQQKFTYKQLFELSHGYDVYPGFYRGQLQRAIEETDKFGKTDRFGMASYRNPRTDQVDAWGVIKMVSGMDLRIQAEAGDAFMTALGKHVASLKWLPGGENFIGNRLGFLMGSAIEGNARCAMFYHALLNEGLDPASAARRAFEALFDYSKTGRPMTTAMQAVEFPLKGTRGEGQGRQLMSTLAPFYEFTFHNFLAHIGTAGRAPGKVALSYRLMSMAEKGVDPRGLAPWDRDNFMVKVPWTSDIALDLTRYIPAAEAATFPSRGMDQFLYGPEQKVANLNPIVEIGLSLFVSNVDPYTLQKIERYPGEKQQVNLPGIGSVDISPRLNYALGNVFRAYREWTRNDALRFMGARTVKDNYPTQLMYERRSILNDVAPLLSALGDTRGRYSDEEKDKVRNRVIQNRADLVRNLAETYIVNDQGKDRGPFLPYSQTGEISRYALLDQMTAAIVGTPDQGGILQTINGLTTMTPEEKIASRQQWWRAWFELEQTKIAYMSAFIGTIPRTRIYGTPTTGEGGPGANDAYQQQLDDAYGSLKDEIRRAVQLSDIGPVTFAAMRNAYLDVVEHQSWDRQPRPGMERRGSWIRAQMMSFDRTNSLLYKQMRELEREGAQR